VSWIDDPSEMQPDRGFAHVALQQNRKGFFDPST
jgi:hypothetical protein